MKWKIHIDAADGKRKKTRKKKKEIHSWGMSEEQRVLKIWSGQRVSKNVIPNPHKPTLVRWQHKMNSARLQSWAEISPCKEDLLSKQHVGIQTSCLSLALSNFSSGCTGWLKPPLKWRVFRIHPGNWLWNLLTLVESKYVAAYRPHIEAQLEMSEAQTFNN